MYSSCGSEGVGVERTVTRFPFVFSWYNGDEKELFKVRVPPWTRLMPEYAAVNRHAITTPKKSGAAAIVRSAALRRIMDWSPDRAIARNGQRRAKTRCSRRQFDRPSRLSELNPLAG